MGVEVTALNVAELAMGQTAAWAAGRDSLPAYPPIYKLEAVPATGWLVRWFSRRMAARIDRVNVRVQNHVVWLRGARANIEESPGAENLDPHDHLRQSLDKLERTVLSALTKAEDLQQELRRAGPKFLDQCAPFVEALAAYQSAALVMVGELRQLGAAVQAHDANLDALRLVGQRRVAATARDLDQQLDSASA